MSMNTKSNDIPLRGRQGASFHNMFLIVGLVVLWAFAITQWVAYKFGFQEALGEGLLNVAGFTLYAPLSFVGWWWKFNASSVEAAEVLETAWLSWAFGSLVMIIVMSNVLGALTRRVGSDKSYDPYSSEWADDLDVEFSGLRAVDSWVTPQDIEAFKSKK